VYKYKAKTQCVHFDICGDCALNFGTRRFIDAFAAVNVKLDKGNDIINAGASFSFVKWVAASERSAQGLRE